MKGFALGRAALSMAELELNPKLSGSQFCGFFRIRLGKKKILAECVGGRRASTRNFYKKGFFLSF